MTTMDAPQFTVAGTGLICLDVVLSDSCKDAQYIQAGGSAGNVLAILGGLGWGASALGRHEPNDISDFIRADLERFGVNTDYIQADKSGSTPIIIQINKHEGTGSPTHRFHWRCPDCDGWLPRFKPPTLKLAQKALGETEAPTVFYFDRAFPAAVRLAEEFQAQGTLVVFEPNSLADDRLHQRALEASDVVKYSHERVKDSAEPLIRADPPLLIETLGEDGLRCRSGGEWLHMPAIGAPFVADTVGSGDWTTGGLLYHLFREVPEPEDWSPEHIRGAAQFGQALAALNCSFVGARGVQYAMSVEDMLATAKDLIQSASNRDAIEERRSSCATMRTNPVCPSCDWVASPATITQ